MKNFVIVSSSIIILFFTINCKEPFDVVIPGSDMEIITFTFDDPFTVGVINENDITLTVPFGTDVTSLTPKILHTGSSINPASGVAQDFTTPVSYKVYADDSSSQDYIVTVLVAAASTTKAITSFSFLIPPVTGEITGTDITVTLPLGTDVTSLTPIVTHTGNNISPTTGSAQNFTNPVTYTVTAEDGTTADYIVYVILGSWNFLGTPGFSDGRAGFTTIAFDTANTPFVAYNDSTVGYKVTVMKFDGINWVLLGPKGFSLSSAYKIILQIDTNDIPYVAYIDSDNERRATVMFYIAGTWQVLGGEEFGSNYESLAFSIGHDDIPYVAFIDSDYDRRLTVLEYSGNTWSIVGAEGFSTGPASSITLCINSEGIPYVGYQDGSNLNRVTVMKFEDNEWQNVGAPGFTSVPARLNFMQFDSTDTPYILYEYGAMYIMKYINGSWNYVGDPITGADRISYPPLAFNSMDTPYVVYIDHYINSRSIVKKFSEGQWQNVGIDGVSFSVGIDASIAIDHNDYVHVAYGASGYYYTRATVKKFE